MQFDSGSAKKRIFILTDGNVGEPEKVIQQAQDHSDHCRVFTFGLGSGCDKNLVTQVANKGRGTSTIVRDGGEDLNGQVVRALQNAMEPSLKAVKLGWNDLLQDANEVFRNQLVHSTCIFSG